jgi:hypothetical protein
MWEAVAASRAPYDTSAAPLVLRPEALPASTAF